MWNAITSPWPWYVSGPLIGLVVPLLLLVGNRQFGVSANLQHMCAAVLPRRPAFLCYDWKSAGAWNLTFALGIVVGGAVGGFLLANPQPFALAQATQTDLAALGLRDFDGILPSEIFDWASLFTARGFIILVVGGFLVGFGARYAGGCTSGHAISGLADLQLPSLIAMMGFFAGGLVATHVLLPLIL
jgi:uncharacterized membrane protein YedE/YeeE